jgi:hypothetical protein
VSPLELDDEEVVSLTVERGEEAEAVDGAYLPLIAEEGDSTVTWAEVRAALAKLPTSLADDFVNERDERF